MKLKLIYFSFFCSILSISCSKEETFIPIEDNQEVGTIAEGFTISLKGTFVAMNGYPTKGGTALGKNKANENVLRLDDDFSTTLATGAVTIYLSKNENLDLREPTSHLKIAIVNKIGLHYFVIDKSELTDFEHVIVWCAPAGISFGSATLE